MYFERSTLWKSAMAVGCFAFSLPYSWFSPLMPLYSFFKSAAKKSTFFGILLKNAWANGREITLMRRLGY